MKKFYLLTSLILLCCVQMANAQPYPSIFGEEKTQYNILEHFTPWKQTPLTAQTKVFYIEKDTIFEEQLYKKITEKGMFFNNQYYLGVREDTIAGKIFLYGKYFGEILVCDFSLSLGDTFFFPQYDLLYPYNHGLSNTNGFMIVDSIYFIDKKKIITFSGPYTIWENIVYEYSSEYITKFTFIEGIGPNYGPFDLVWEERMILCIYKDNDLVYIQREDLGCDYNNIGGSVNERELDRIKIIPNPVSNEFHIQRDLTDLDEVFIYTIHGQYVSHVKLQKDSQKINITMLQAGIYLLKAKDIQGNIYTTKLIKL